MLSYLLLTTLLTLMLLGLAPTPSARVTPTGYKMPDGYQTLITFAANTSVNLWEKAVKPPAIDGGEAIDTTTMLNTRWRTMDSRHLITIGKELTVTCAYDPDVIGDLLNLVNEKTTVTVKFPENSSWCFYAFAQKFEFGELKEGEFPEVTVTICVTNWDYVNQVEAGPVFTAAVGT